MICYERRSALTRLGATPRRLPGNEKPPSRWRRRDPHPRHAAGIPPGWPETDESAVRSGDRPHTETALSAQLDLIEMAWRFEDYAEDVDARGNHQRAADLRRLAEALRAKEARLIRNRTPTLEF